MSNRKAKDKWGATHGKLALVALLSVVLVMVVAGQFSSEETANQARATDNRRPSIAQKPSAPQGPNEHWVELGDWPELTMQEVLQHDPFMVPAWAAPEIHRATTPGSAFQLNDGQLQQLQQQGASVVMISSQDKIATVGDQQIRIGDSIQGYSVIDITPQGIVLADPKSR